MTTEYFAFRWLVVCADGFAAPHHSRMMARAEARYWNTHPFVRGAARVIDLGDPDPIRVRAGEVLTYAYHPSATSGDLIEVG